jgi:spore coat protein U-like protein
MKSRFPQRRAKLVLVSAIALAAAGVSLDSHAAGTATSDLAVSASIAANCTISTSPVAFGAYDPITANKTTALNGTGSVTTTCTSGAAVTVTLGQGLNPIGDVNVAPVRQMASGANRLGYFLYSNTARTTAWGNTAPTGVADTGTGATSTLTVYGAITANQNQPTGDYLDTVLATVTF